MPVSSSQSPSIKRRQLLSGLLKLLVFIGLIFVSVPFISSLSSNSIDKKKQVASSPWVITVPVSELNQGEVRALSWAGGIVWIYKRTEHDIKALKIQDDFLRDASSQQSEQPEDMKNNLRSVSEKFFVFIPLENKRGCQVSLLDEDGNDEGERGLFTEPCYSAKFDAAGRILKNTGHKSQQNLAVPEHIIEDGILKIGIWSPKIK